SVLFFRILLLPPQSPLFPYTTLFRSPLRRQAQELLAEPGTPGQAVAQVAQPGRLSDPGRIARQVGDKAFAQRHALLPGALMQYRSEEHTSELQSRENLVCRLLLEKKK